MTFFVTIALYAISAVVIVRKRVQLATFFTRKFSSTFKAVLMSGLAFTALEESIVNLMSGTLHVLLATVPVMVVLLLIVGYGVKKFLTRPPVNTAISAYVMAGLVFEITIGHLGKVLAATGFGPEIVFGILLNIFAYAYIAVVPFQILFAAKSNGFAAK